MRELASGVDALYLSGRGCLAPAFLDRLAESRRFADDVRLPVPFELGGRLLLLQPHGFGRYRYCLDGDGLRVGVTPSTKLPSLRVQPRAALLHSAGPKGALDAVTELLSPVCDGLVLSTSRLDLFVDVEGWALAGSDRDHFVCRGDALRTYETNGRFTGFAFGTRTTKTFAARIYDKTAEIAAKGNDWWLALWGDRHREGERALRVEVEIGREALREFAVTGPEEVLAAAGDLWRYATTDWLTFRSPTGDATRSRWPVATEWRTVQAATLANAQLGAERIRSGRTAGSLRRLVPGLTGYLVGAAVLLGTDHLEDTFRAVHPHLRRYERLSKRPFTERVARRKAEAEA